MIRSFRKFFEFAGRQSRNWYLGLFYEIIRCILEALQFAALLVVLDGLVRDNITAQTALLAFGIMLVSVIGTIIFWYLAHGKEGEGSYRMCEDKRIQIGNRMKYMPMGYFNSHSLGKSHIRFNSDHERPRKYVLCYHRADFGGCNPRQYFFCCHVLL